MELSTEQDDYYLPAGKLLKDGSYRIGQKLGEGGFGITYNAIDLRDPDQPAEVVIKELYRQDFCDRDKETHAVVIQKSDQRTEFQKLVNKQLEEGNTLSRLDHDHIVMNLDTFKENGTAYIVMNRLIGTDLGEVLNQQGVLSPDLALKYTLHVLSALSYIHERSITHLDIKPSNIFIQRQREIKRNDGSVILVPDNSAILIDFGASLTYDRYGVVKSNTTKLISGISSYAPVEQASLSHLKKFDPRLDTFSLAGTFYHCLTGEMPATPNLRMSGNLVLQLPTEISPNKKLDPLFDSILVKGLNTITAERFQTANEFLSDCLELPKASALRAIKEASVIMNGYYKLAIDEQTPLADQYRIAREKVTIINEAIVALSSAQVKDPPATASEDAKVIPLSSEFEEVSSDYRTLLSKELGKLRIYEHAVRIDALLSVLTQIPELIENGLTDSIAERKSFLLNSGTDLNIVISSWASSSDDQIEFKYAVAGQFAKELAAMLPESALRALVDAIKELPSENGEDSAIKALLVELAERLEYTRILTFKRQSPPIETPPVLPPAITHIPEPSHVEAVKPIILIKDKVEQSPVRPQKRKFSRVAVYAAGALLAAGAIGTPIVFWLSRDQEPASSGSVQTALTVPDSSIKAADTTRSTYQAPAQQQAVPQANVPRDTSSARIAVEPTTGDKLPETPEKALNKFDTDLRNGKIKDQQLEAMVKTYPQIKQEVVNKLAQKAAKVFDVEVEDHVASKHFSAMALKLYYADGNKVQIDSTLFDFITNNSKN